MNISETSMPIAIKFYLYHHCGRVKVALDFGADLFRTLRHHFFSADFD